jgi:hypothetical protein
MIPKKFQLMGKSFTVKVIGKNNWEDPEIWGQCDFANNTIEVLDLNPETNEQTFFHELVHAILMTMNNKLNKNETFVDMFGALLHQALKTSK